MILSLNYKRFTPSGYKDSGNSKFDLWLELIPSKKKLREIERIDEKNNKEKKKRIIEENLKNKIIMLGECKVLRRMGEFQRIIMNWREL